MLRKGYQAAGVDELCRLAGARKGSFYHFFPAKADLALAALEFRWTHLRDHLFEAVNDSGARGLDRLRRFVDAADTLQRQQWADARVLGSAIGAFGQEMASQDDRIRAAIQVIVEAQCGYLRRWLDEAAVARQITPGDNETRARDILALLEGALLLGKIAGNPDVFRQVCGALPAVVGKGPTVRPAVGTAPELS